MNRINPSITSNSDKFIIEGLSKSFGKKKILDNIDLKVKNKECLVILGGSGSGKSVLIKTIVGLIAPDCGKIYYDNKLISNITKSQRDELMSHFGFLFQGGALFDSLKVWENIAFSLIHNKNISKDDAKDIAAEKLKLVGLSKDILRLYPSELSGGMQKRVALARAIAANPDVIFFDEPTTGLDPIMSNVINELIIKCREELGATTIVITHDINSARMISSRLSMLYQGKIIWTCDAKDIDNEDNPIFEQFIHGNLKGPISLNI